MKIFPLLFIGLVVLNAPLHAEGGINVDKVIVNHNKKIQKLNKRYKSLLNEIDQLNETQKISDAKIKELFRLLEFKKTNEVVKQTVTLIKRDNRKAKKIYTSARSLLLTDQFSEAVVMFQSYLKDYPENSNADDAHYWLARSYLAMHDYNNAKDAFIGYQQDNPKHHKFSNSLIELARVYIELGEKGEATKVLDLMIKKTPNHNSINKAKQMLSELKTQAKEASEQSENSTNP